MVHVRQRLRLWRNAGYARRRWATWLAVLALTAQILAPFAQALASDGGQGPEYQLICTANGVKKILIGADGAPIEPHDAAPCPFCLTFAAQAMLQPEVMALLYTELRLDPVVFAPVAHLGHANTWRRARQPSRAPPCSV